MILGSVAGEAVADDGERGNRLSAGENALDWTIRRSVKIIALVHLTMALDMSFKAVLRAQRYKRVGVLCSGR